MSQNEEPLDDRPPAARERERVLLLVRGERDRDLLTDRLGDYDVVVGDPDAGDPLPEFDLCLVDTATYPAVADRLADRKDAAGATYLPVLLVLGPHDREGPARERADVADDVLSVPAAEAVFQSRVESLLRARRQSLELDARREQLALYRRAMDDAASGITISDAGDDQPLTYANDAFLEITGYDREEVLGRNCRFLQGEGTAEEPVREMREAIETGTAAEVELRNYRKDGTEFWNHVEIAPVYEDGDLTHFVGLQENVTERRELEERLREETETLERLLETSPVAITVLDTEGNIVRANETAEEELGLERSEVVGRTFDAPEWEIFDEDGEPVPSEDLPFSRVLATGETVTDYEHGTRADGEERWLSINAAPLEDADGDLVGVVAAVDDVTERKEREQELEHERERFRTLAETASDAIVTIDADSTVLYANSAVERVFGYEPDAIVGESLTALMPEHLRDDHEAGIARFLDTGERSIDWTGIRFEGLHADGHEVPLEVSFAEYEIGDQRRFTGIIRDITEQVEREQELERALDLLDKSQNIAGVGGWENDYATGEVIWTAETYDILDLPRDYEPDLDDIIELYHPEDREEVAAAGERALEEGEPYDLEVRVVTAEDRVRWVRLRGEPSASEGGQVLRGTVRDITERKERERELERTLDLLDQTQDIADVGGWEIDPTTGEVLFTDGLSRMLGVEPRTEFDLGEAFAFFHPEDEPEVRETFERLLATDEPQEVECRIVTEGDDVRWVNVRGITVPGTDDSIARGTVLDVTERKERERELERTVSQLRQTRDIAGVSSWEYDVESGELQWGEKVRDITGLPESFEPTEENVLALYPSESRERLEEAMRRAIVEREPFDLELQMAGEPTTWVQITGEPVGGDDETERVRGVVRNVTQRKRREEFLERYERIVETASDPIYTLDGEMRFTLVNGATADLAGRDEAGLTGEHVSTVFGERHAEAVADATVTLVANGANRTTIETTVTDASGNERQFQTLVTVKPAEEGKRFQGVVCVSRDVTELRERERRLSVLDRVLRHNLRNKMNVVVAQAAMVLEATEDESVRTAAEGIERAGEELLELGESARKFHSTIDSGAGELTEPRNVAEHARLVVEAARTSYGEATITADVPETAWARTHETFELALSELLDNAVTHGGEGVSVTVSVDTDVETDLVVVCVADDGPGIPPVERRALQSGLESPLQHTTGLGLWFVRWMATNSGGSMTIADNDPTGTVVELRLPAAEPDE